MATPKYNISIDYDLKQEPLEPGDDGTFDLGGPSPPLPADKLKASRKKGDYIAPSAEKAPPGSPEIEDDWEKVEAKEGEGPLLDSPGATSEGGLEEFKDAVETLRPQADHTKETDDNVQPTKLALETAQAVLKQAAFKESSPPSAAQPQEFRRSFISKGLSNVRLPMGYKPMRVGVTEEEDTDTSSEGEGEFHDTFDSAAGLAKDANKAQKMKEAGNGHYKCGEFEDAVDYYTMALHYCPEDEEHKKDRAVYLANRAQGHLRLEEFDKVVDDCTAALELDPSYLKALMRRAEAYEHLEKYDYALEDAKALMEIDPSLRATKEKLTRLETLQTEKNEKMKEEAIGKLKELGNSVLGNFGLSIDNFKMQQDPNTGSYSINFEK